MSTSWRFARLLSPSLYSDWLGFPENARVAFRDRLKALRGFRFQRHPNYNLPVGRLRALEDFIQIRADEIGRMNGWGSGASHPSGDTVKGKHHFSDETVIGHLRADPFITAAELVRLTGVSLATIRRCLSRLKAAGKICRRGSDKTGWWRVEN